MPTIDHIMHLAGCTCLYLTEWNGGMELNGMEWNSGITTPI